MNLFLMFEAIVALLVLYGVVHAICTASIIRSQHKWQYRIRKAELQAPPPIYHINYGEWDEADVDERFFQ